MQSISIPGRFNGPLTSGHGGYCSGVIADFVEGPAEVTLRSPVPLDTPLEIIRDDRSVRVLDGETLIAEASPGSELDLEVPARVSPGLRGAPPSATSDRPTGSSASASSAGEAGRARLGCLPGRSMAVPSSPPRGPRPTGPLTPMGRCSRSSSGGVDCPTYFAVYTDGELPMSFLGRMATRIDAPVTAGEQHVVIAWPIGVDGRKRHAGAAVLSGEGVPLAGAEALMIEPREGSG